MAQKITVSVVVLSWNCLEETKACLESLRNLAYVNKEIIIVDNGSKDGSKEYLQQQADIIYVDLPKNLGFTGGQIEGYRVAKGKFIALVNNDAVVAPDWLDRLLEPMKDNKVAAVGGRAYLWNDKSPAYDTNNPFYSYQVVDLWGGYAQTLMTGDEITEVNSISGAGLLICRSAIDKVGYFDNRFFAYFEETDLIARLKRNGFKAIYQPTAHTWHQIAASTKDKPMFYLYQMHRNRFIYAAKNFDPPFFKKMLAGYAIDAFKSMGRLLRTPNPDDAARVKAFRWNVLNLTRTLADRAKTQKLGSTYSTLLLEDACQTVSVIIPCYNYEKFVSAAIESVLKQTQKPLEIIVINDGSTDGSLEAINKYSEKVRIIDKPNSGVVDTKNLGIKEARGDWIIFLDADDYLEPTYIEDCLSLAREGNLNLVYSDMRLFGSTNEYFAAKKHSINLLRSGNYIHNSALIKIDLIRRAGGYKAEMSHGYEDWELYITLSELGVRAGWISKPLLNYRQHRGNDSRNIMAISKSSDIFKTVYSLHPATFSYSYFLQKRLSAQLHSVKLYPSIHTLRYWFGKTLLTRKIWGLTKLLATGKYDQILPKVKNHALNAKAKITNTGSK